MCELPWYALAEIFLNNDDNSKEIYCLCSRVFLRNKDESFKRSVFSNEFSASEEDLLIDDEISSECSSLPQFLKYKLKHDNEPETVSCYCSASHTDNLSTDEHDSLRESHDLRSHRGLQSSDSGADLTECIKHDIDSVWQKFWSHNGERLIWESWIAKYSAYINPDYLQNAQDQVKEEKEQHFIDKRILTLDLQSANVIEEVKEDFKKTDRDVKNRILIRNLSGSDDILNTDVSEGWNPLSPISIECETEVEQLLSSKCGSHVSSLRTVDSMTNVTRMTISSLELSQSSHNSDSFSSVSSVQSSLSSTSSEEIEEDYHHQWNVLWKKHYEDEFLKQYEIFVTLWKEENITDISIGEKIEGSISTTANAYLSSPSHTHKQKKKNIHKVFQGKVERDELKCPIQVNSNVAKSLGTLLNNLKVSSEENSIMDNMQKGEDCESNSEEQAQMAALGLPTSFTTKVRKRSREIIEEGDLSYSVNDDFECSRKKIKAAFNLLGIEFQDAEGEALGGQVNYKMKHIRLQNRHLKLRNNSNSVQTPKHIHFDDDGNEKFQNILLDSSDDKQSSGDEAIIAEIVSPKSEEVVEDTTPPKRRKRKRKINMPQEIKENNDLIKYWKKRFTLFNRFDEGIKLDEGMKIICKFFKQKPPKKWESWYSVTPEQIAKHTAQRCKCDIIIDGFCGAGGNSIQFALTCKRVIAIDIDPNKIELARNNARIYGVEQRIEFIVGDFFKLAPTLKGDVVFLSPPWGGPSYLKKDVYDLDSMLQPVPISKLLQVCRAISSNIAVFLPRNSNAFLLIDQTKPFGGVEIEQNFIQKRLVAITAYYGDLIKKL